MQDSKITFSTNELILLHDSEFFRQKKIITKKIELLFNELNEKIEIVKKKNENFIPADAFKGSGKISRGENYLGLPYVVLDNPRVFHKKDVFAYRTMFWWGNYFSFTFHLSGKYLEIYQKSILKNFENLNSKKNLICIHSEQWIHHLEKDNYKSIDSFDSKKIKNLIKQNKFLKISCKLDLKKLNQVADFGTTTLEEYFLLLKS